MTNFEKIKQMSVEEMAESIVNFVETLMNGWNVITREEKARFITSAEKILLTKLWVEELESEVQEDE